MGKPPLTTRRRYHIALGAARHLFAGGEISASGCGALKNHIFDDDGRVAAAVEIFWLNVQLPCGAKILMKLWSSQKPSTRFSPILGTR